MEENETTEQEPKESQNDATPAETGELADSGEGAGEATPQLVPLKALEAERRKRQDFEREIQQLRAQQEALMRMQQGKEQAQAPAPEKKVSDDDLNAELVRNPVAFIRKFYDTEHKKRSDEAFSHVVRHDIARLKDEMEDGASDFQQMATVFDQQAAINPELSDRYRHAARPAKFGYLWAKRFVERQAKQEEASTQIKAMQEENAKLKKQLEELSIGGPAAQVPTSNAGAKSTGRVGTPAANRDVDDIEIAKRLYAKRHHR
jgi:hypothetical protein